MKKASEVFNAMIDSLISSDEQRNAVLLFSTWTKIVGINEGSHSKIVEIENNTLFVKVDHPGWLQRLEIKKKTILKRLNHDYPELALKNIRFFL